MKLVVAALLSLGALVVAGDASAQQKGGNVITIGEVTIVGRVLTRRAPACASARRGGRVRRRELSAAVVCGGADVA
jgi:hypothetical protein